MAQKINNALKIIIKLSVKSVSFKFIFFSPYLWFVLSPLCYCDLLTWMKT